ncbi:diversity-generating retroelement protein Avd [Patescibacteria group bacterium]|nr:diversity-generating retroelement protein Avd [Patescibacteria group bacterium]
MPIFHKTYGCIFSLSAWHRQCPKAHRHGIAQYCYNLGLDLLKLLIRANAETGYRKLAHLKEASLMLDQLKIFIRLAKDVGGLSPKQYVQFQQMLQDIGKQLGGWIKSLQTKEPAHGGPIRKM